MLNSRSVLSRGSHHHIYKQIDKWLSRVVPGPRARLLLLDGLDVALQVAALLLRAPLQRLQLRRPALLGAHLRPRSKVIGA